MAWIVTMIWLLAPITVAKVANIKAVEFLLLGLVPLAGLAIYEQGGQLRLKTPLAKLALLYLLFFGLATLLAVWSLRQEFYPPSEASHDVMRMAPFTSFTSLIQLALCVSAFIVLAHWFARSPSLLEFAARLYVWVGVLLTIYAIVSYVALQFFEVNLLGAYTQELVYFVRARALFAEGGEFGLYTVSVVLVAAFRRYVLHDLGRATLWLFIVPLLMVGLILSASKSGMICLLAILVWNFGRRIRFSYLLVGVTACALFAIATPLLSGLEGYWFVYQNYDRIAYAYRNDPNITMGRAAAVSVIPAMVEQHPLLGIGIGNYGLLRDDPKIGIPGPDAWDLAGLGIFTYTAELGLPLFLFFLWLVWRPWRLAKLARLPDAALMLAGFQLFAQGIEIQPTFLYPWLVSAMAVGYWLSGRGTPDLGGYETSWRPRKIVYRAS